MRYKSRNDNKISDTNKGTSKSVSKDTRKVTTAKAKDVSSKKKSSNKENISTENEKTNTKKKSNEEKSSRDKKTDEKKSSNEKINSEKKPRNSEKKGETGQENTNLKKSTITLQPMNDSDTSSSEDDEYGVKDMDKIEDKVKDEDVDDLVSEKMKRGRLTPGSVAVENKSTSRYSNSSSINR